VGEPYKAVWLSYVYQDVTENSPIEECTETLCIGRSRLALSPDVVHRLNHFWTAFSQSMEVNPSSSRGQKWCHCACINLCSFNTGCEISLSLECSHSGHFLVHKL